MAFVSLDLNCDEAFLVRTYREILKPTFSEDKLVNEDIFVNEFRSGAAVGLAVAERPKRALATIVGYPYDDVLLVGYIAARSDVRSHGLGAELLELAEERWHYQERFQLVLAEIDDPRFFPDGDALRRLRFFDAHGAKLVSGPYFQPRLTTQGNRVYGMLLAALWWKRGAMSDAGLRAKLIVGFLHRYFSACEHGPPQDDEYAELVRTYETVLSVPMLPPAAYSLVTPVIPRDRL